MWQGATNQGTDTEAATDISDLTAVTLTQKKEKIGEKKVQIPTHSMPPSEGLLRVNAGFALVMMMLMCSPRPMQPYRILLVTVQLTSN